MKKFLPFVFPLIALLIVLFLAVRWYSSRTAREGQVPEFGEGMKIEELSQDELKRLNQPATLAQDLKTVKLEATGEASGEVRYEMKDGKVLLTVTAQLADLPTGKYQVWLKSGDKSPTKAFVLQIGKGGYMGSAAVTADLLPVEVTVTKEMQDDAKMEEVILKGTIQKESK